MLNTTQENMKEEINQEIGKGVRLDHIRDTAGEWVDGWLPVYNNQIIEEWQKMPSEYDNRGANELGWQEAELDIVKLMRLDLYLYYTDLFNEVLDEIEEDDAVYEQELEDEQDSVETISWSSSNPTGEVSA
jgi:hypothetical protein